LAVFFLVAAFLGLASPVATILGLLAFLVVLGLVARGFLVALAFASGESL